mmetsp:Transcript_37527/g.101702  ORF Transcript_37527/g.101702 Transcript_37527/m.101702 type:complete len:271 (+) Transcript_37527:1323-2135(+)
MRTSTHAHPSRSVSLPALLGRVKLKNVVEPADGFVLRRRLPEIQPAQVLRLHHLQNLHVRLGAGDPPDEPLELGLQRGLNHARYDARAEVPQPAEPPRLVRILRVVQRHVQAVDVRQVTEVEATRRRRGREEYSGRRRRAPDVKAAVVGAARPPRAHSALGQQSAQLARVRGLLGARLALKTGAHRTGELLEDLQRHGAVLRQQRVEFVLPPQRVLQRRGRLAGVLIRCGEYDCAWAWGARLEATRIFPLLNVGTQQPDHVGKSLPPIDG